MVVSRGDDPVSLRGNPRKLRDLRRSLREIPVVTAQRVAARVAPELTALAGEAYDSGRTVYGDPRRESVEGGALDLVESGKTRERVAFAATGTQVRAVLGTRYARFLIGKYRILPIRNLPAEWSHRIGGAARDEIAKAVKA